MATTVCKENGCGGTVDTEKGVNLRTGCRSAEILYPCDKCGRLYWKNGESVNGRDEKKAFFIGGEQVLK